MARKRVVIAGGGFAALEVALGLRALAKDRVQVRLISPNRSFVYRPAATLEPFGDEPTATHDLRAIAADLGASYLAAALEAVAPQQRWVRLDSGLRLDYDSLVLALGARARIAIPGALTFRDQRDLPRLKNLLDELGRGTIRRLVFAVPSRDSWSLPLYELALLSAKYATERSTEVEVVVVSPEPAPLAVFGTRGSRRVADLLAQRQIRFVGSAVPHSVQRDGSLALQFDAPIAADRVVAMPQLHGPRITGIPASWSGFVPTDSLGRVEGLADVYAAGDLTTFPVKQGGVAAQQADVIAQTIAADLGAPVREVRHTRTLRARLLHGDGALVLRTELDTLGRPTRATVEHHETRGAADLKVFGQYLTPYLAIHPPRVKTAA